MTTGTGQPTDSAAERTAARQDVPEELRAEVRLLGDALGQVLTEAGGPELLADVERLRHAVIAARTGAAGADDAAGVADSLDLARAEQVARAFSVYFQLVNLAEERGRVRVLRAESGPPRRDTFGALRAEAEAGRLAPLLAGLRVHPVITAHPTEARRRAVVTAIARVDAQLNRIADPGAGTAERAEAAERLLEHVSVLWRTAQLRRDRPGPLDEVRTAMAVFDESLFALVPTVYRSFDRAIGEPDAAPGPPRVPAFLRFGSWVGGDRDGNPNVTSAVTRAALDVQADHVLRAIANATTRVGRALTLDAGLTPPSAPLRAALRLAADAHPALLAGLTTTSPGEPHRVFLLYAAARVTATRARDADLRYPGAAELLADLRLTQDSLAAAGAARVAYGALQDLIWQVETFGFHLAELEVRQHSGAHAAALRELGFDPADAAALDRVARDGAAIDDTSLSEATREVLATLRTVAALQARWGTVACRRYVVSFTSRAADLVAVRALARLALGDRPVELDVVPLFETQHDLQQAIGVLDAWLPLASTQAQLTAAGARLEVMLGYSDSAKDVGPVSAAFALHAAQGDLGAWARRTGVVLTLFHGRGGALGRGGGPAARAVLSSAAGSLAGRFKVTEQGEVVFARYGTPAIGVRHLEQVTTSVLRASAPEAERRTAQAADRHGELAACMGTAAKAAYRALVGAEGFAEFVARVSPLEELAQLQIGSRPARRGTGGDLASLRAIPWVFAWAQTRCNLPGWYGLGAGLAAATERFGPPAVRQAYREWPLLASILDNAEMSLAKADRGIAARYLALGDRPDLSERILTEFDDSVRELLAVLGTDRLLGGHRVLGRAVELRNPYVDALSYLQLRALSVLRGTPPPPGEPAPEIAAWERLLLLTVGGVAAGLQNTG
ncbi:MAG TPA: phosphoenolpyruvate carboxylase [Mycobacteriales bacterium]|nr:phosphoenolpyruvate carboxylase [Mycobacteriales bacterium]